MELTSVPVNIFVLGDLVLDHFIPGTAKHRPYQAVGSERVFDGHPRRTIPGGAANCARLLAALSRGRVCLWGLSGHSPWGSFAQILEKSHRRDRSDRGVIFHGSHNESHQMNTITRLVSFDDAGIRHREFRVDDLHYVPTTEWQHRDAIAHLQAEVTEHGIHAIILNDLDMNALTESLILDIGNFAQKERIPIFVDPKRNWSKYRKIHVTCALPNLREWCHIVEDIDGYNGWRRAVQEGKLEAMAVRCLRYMPNVDFHLITCDALGVVLIAPDGTGRRMICRVEPHPARTDRLPGQLGAGDILASALTMEHSGLSNERNQSDRMLKALEKALAVVACYLEMDWQEVPNEREIRAFDLQRMKTLHTRTVPESVLLLPEGDVELHNFSILGSKLVSRDVSYVAKVKDAINFLREGWENSDCYSAIITGKGGVGKSELTKILERELSNIYVSVWINFDCSRAKCPDVDAAIDQIFAKTKQLKSETKGLLVVIDEAFSKAAHLLLNESGKNLLQGTATCELRTRFLFVDADFERHRGDLSESQFLNRCKEFVLPPLHSRHGDIPYIFASNCLELLGVSSVRISEAVLLGLINSILNAPESKQSPRQIYRRAEEVTASARRHFDTGSRQITEISKRYLPDDLKDGLESTGVQRRFFTFSR
jgi:bifunctional ADP-heptose synthase (sugar kinase/adenylyltransferase)